MPVYLFTWHAYGSWLPDRPRGFVHRTRGLQPQDAALAERYREKQSEPPATFTPAVQTTLVATCRDAVPHLDAVLHGVATDPTHVHALIAWDNNTRSFESVRTSVRTALTRALNTQHRRRTWLARGGSRKHVADTTHHDHLLLTYLPQHRGMQWYDDTLIKAAQRRSKTPGDV